MSEASTPLTDQLAWVRDQEEKTHRQRRFTNLVVVVACLATLAVVTYTWISLTARLDAAAVRDNQVLTIAKQATGPAERAAAKTFRDTLILCVENHLDRVADVALRAPVVPLAAGCPADVLP